MIIYKTTNLINGKFYIGKDKNNNPEYIGSGKLLNQAIEKYGIENFFKEVLEECNNEIELNEREIYWIKKLNARVRGYNIASGGEGGDTISQHPDKESIAKQQSEWMMENNPMRGKTRSQESIEKWKDSFVGKYRGKKNSNYGRTHSKESKITMSEKRKKWWDELDDETREEISNKISESNTGNVGYWNDKKNPKHSKWMKENNPMKGKTHTNEVKEKISIANSKPKSEEHKRKISESLKGNIPTNAISIIINEVKYESLSEASREFGVSVGTIKRRISSDKEEFKGYKYE